MNKSDLQIGNYVNYEQTTHVITELHNDEVIHRWINISVGENTSALNDVYQTSYGDIKQIEISENELLRFGFEHSKKNVSFNMGGELFDYWEKMYGEVGEFGIRPAFIIWTDKKISFFSLKGILKTTDRKYSGVHELQQLYKLFTNEELKYERIV